MDYTLNQFRDTNCSFLFFLAYFRPSCLPIPYLMIPQLLAKADPPN
jgi:hypothetical protein